MERITDKDVFYCSAAARYFKEGLAGTAAHYQAYILIEHSDPFPGKIGEAHFNKEWLKEMQLLAKSVRGKLLLIRNKKSDFKNCRIIFVDCKKSAWFAIQTTIIEAVSVKLGEYIDAADTHWQTDPFFVICTNGKKDKCCAKFGFPVFKFFESFNADVPVWECTHVGGDRFAANVVAMPFGIYYGHVAVEDVGHIMVRTLLRKIYRNNYRGISRRSFFEQAIECHLREYLQNYDIDFEMQVKLVEHEGDLFDVEITTKGFGVFLMQLTRQSIPYPHYLTCKSETRENIVKFKLNHITHREPFKAAR